MRSSYRTTLVGEARIGKVGFASFDIVFIRLNIILRRIRKKAACTYTRMRDREDVW